jgi:hypothetical protein
LRAFEQRALAIEVFGTTGSQACGEIERHAGLASRKETQTHVEAAEGCDLLILLLNNKIKRSQPSAAPTKSRQMAAL